MIQLFIITIVLLAIAFIGISINVLQSRRFPEFHVGRNKDMRKRGIACAKCEDAGNCSISLHQCNDNYQNN